MGINAGKRIGNATDLRTFLLTLSSSNHTWDVLYISELCVPSDSFSDNFYDLDNVRVYQHWPGGGSIPMAFVVKRYMLPSIFDVAWSGRSGSLLLRSTNPRLPFAVVGAHLAHGGELHDSLSHVSSLICKLPQN